MRESKPLLHRDTWVNMMLASRNQMNVMSRGFGNTANGSLPAYGAQGEMNTYLQGVRHTPLRALGGEAQPKPNFQPITPGQTMDTQEISTTQGWSVVYVVRNSAGYYVVEHVNPKTQVNVVDGHHPNMDEAKESANRIAFQLRNTGSTSGFSSYGTMAVIAASAMYVGADFPGARPVGKQIAKTFNEPRNFVNRILLFGGLGTLVILTIVEGQK